jgi:hypothetical protein
MKSVCWNGCSFTVGEGFPENLRSTYIYNHLVTQKFLFDSVNQAKSGSSNYKIFMKSVEAVLSNKYDLIFVQWTALNRLWLYPGPDCEWFLNDEKYPDFKYRDIYIDPTTSKTIKNIMLLLNHDYQNVFDVIDYSCILEKLAGSQSRIVFINGILPWCDDLAQPTNKFMLDQTLSKYTKDLLDFDHRDDKEIELFLDQLKNKFSQLNTTLWVNLFDSFFKNSVDIGPEGHHPGIKSHQWMADKVSNYLITNQLV